MNLDFTIKPGEFLLDEAAVLVVELARRLQDRCGDVVCPNILKDEHFINLSLSKSDFKQHNPT